MGQRLSALAAVLVIMPARQQRPRGSLLYASTSAKYWSRRIAISFAAKMKSFPRTYVPPILGIAQGEKSLAMLGGEMQQCRPVGIATYHTIQRNKVGVR